MNVAYHIASWIPSYATNSRKMWRGEVGNRPSPHALLSQGTRLPFLSFAAHSAAKCGVAEYGVFPKTYGELLYVLDFAGYAFLNSSD
jgi:hypothetical protein